MVSRAAPSGTETVFEEPQAAQEESKVVQIHLRPPKHVTWSEGTIDNEGMDKRKSKSKLELNRGNASLFKRGWLTCLYYVVCSMLHFRGDEREP